MTNTIIEYDNATHNSGWNVHDSAFKTSTLVTACCHCNAKCICEEWLYHDMAPSQWQIITDALMVT